MLILKHGRKGTKILPYDKILGRLMLRKHEICAFVMH